MPQGRVGDRDARLRRARAGRRRVGLDGLVPARRFCPRDAQADVLSHPGLRDHLLAVGGVGAARGFEASGPGSAHDLGAVCSNCWALASRTRWSKRRCRCSLCGCCAAPWPITRSSSPPSSVRSSIAARHAGPRFRFGGLVACRGGRPGACAPAHPQRRECRMAYRRSGGAVRLGVQLLAADERLLDRDFYRHEIPGPIAPGQSVDVEVSCPVPETTGPHYFKFDLVEEGVTWFEPQGSSIARHAIEVTSPA